MKYQIKKLLKQLNKLKKELGLIKQLCYNTNMQNYYKKGQAMQKQIQIDILDVAQYIINYQNKSDYTKMKLQKLVFLVYCKYYVDYKKELFPNDFEAWEYGPVSPKLYLKTLSYTSGFQKSDQIKENFKEDCFTSEQKK
ncbi:DUF4065 domain-containing protein [Paulownia witches'-broom phytoplasma]|nr:type II toxin-antitoxin system antitoxin SocA domain-containing protein [Paulownia witches'-broom phytoplasma]QYC31208.1 DUF4065 domain-containing protein [Paulownia witches'-broom phytoplasma]